jgi:cystathionine beta-lyase/cystathionine gamma-synthase
MLSDTGLYEKVRFAQNAAGAVAGPMDCWLVLRGIKTLAVRLQRHCSNAKKVAEFLGGHAEVSKVIYPAFT